MPRGNTVWLILQWALYSLMWPCCPKPVLARYCCFSILQWKQVREKNKVQQKSCSLKSSLSVADYICSRLAFLLQSGIQPPHSLPQGLYIYWCFYSVSHLWGGPQTHIFATWYHHLGCGHFDQNGHLTQTKLTQPDSSLRIRPRDRDWSGKSELGQVINN